MFVTNTPTFTSIYLMNSKYPYVHFGHIINIVERLDVHIHSNQMYKYKHNLYLPYKYKDKQVFILQKE